MYNLCCERENNARYIRMNIVARAINTWTTAHLSACVLERFQFFPSLVMFPSFLFSSAECIFKFARTALRSREREPRSRVARVRQPLAPLLVSHFVVTVLSKVAISRSKCHRERSKSDRIVKNLHYYEIGRRLPIIHALSRDDGIHFDGDNSFLLNRIVAIFAINDAYRKKIPWFIIPSVDLRFFPRAIFGIAINEQRWILTARWILKDCNRRIISIDLVKRYIFLRV